MIVYQKKSLLGFITLFSVSFILIRGLVIFAITNDNNFVRFALIIFGLIYLVLISNQVIEFFLRKRVVSVRDGVVTVSNSLYIHKIKIPKESSFNLIKFKFNFPYEESFIKEYFIFIKTQIRGVLNLNFDTSVYIESKQKTKEIIKNISEQDGIKLVEFLDEQIRSSWDCKQ